MSMVATAAERPAFTRTYAVFYFKELGRSDRVLALLIDGEPNADDPAMECYPRALRFGVQRDDGGIDWTAPADPIAADVRPAGTPAEGWTSAAAYQEALEEDATLTRWEIADRTKAYEQRLELAKLKVIAGAFGLPLGELTRRNQMFELAKARRRTRVLASWLLIVALLAVAVGVAGFFAVRNQRRAEEQTRVAEAREVEAARERDRALRPRAGYARAVREVASRLRGGAP